MSETPRVEMQDKDSNPAWGKNDNQGERFKLSSTSIFWILAPIFLLLPWVVYLRNKEEGVRPAPQFPVQIESSKGGEPSFNIPEISERGSEAKTKAPPVQRYSSLQIVGMSPRTIPPGSQIKAILVMGASNGPVKAKTTQSLVVDGEVLLESGVTLLGQAQSGPDRLFVAFNKMVWPDGSSKDMSAQGYDLSDMIPGLKGSQVRSQALKFAAAASLNFLGGLSEGLQETRVYGGIPVKDNSLKNAALNGAAHAALDQGKSLLESASNAQNVIEVKANTPLWIVFGGDH